MTIEFESRICRAGQCNTTVMLTSAPAKDPAPQFKDDPHYTADGIMTKENNEPCIVGWQLSRGGVNRDPDFLARF